MNLLCTGWLFLTDILEITAPMASQVTQHSFIWSVNKYVWILFSALQAQYWGAWWTLELLRDPRHRPFGLKAYAISWQLGRDHKSLGRRCRVAFLEGDVSWISEREQGLQMYERKRELFLLREEASTHKQWFKTGICEPIVGPTRLGEAGTSFWEVAGNKFGKVS